MVVLLIIGFLLIISMEVPAMLVKGQTRELRAFWVLLALGFALSLAVVMDWPVPSPTPFLRAVFEPISDMLGFK